MEMSSEVSELFKALSKFGGEVDNATKNAVNPGVKSKYADLAACINAAKPHLAANGLAVTQPVGTNSEGKTTLTTLVTHSSGQWLKDVLVMVDAKLHGSGANNPAQILGSSISYQRRYCFAAILNMAQEDDDANSLSSNKGSQNRVQQQQQQQPPKLIDQGQVTILSDMITAKGYTTQQACETWQLKSVSEIQSGMFQTFVDNVNNW